MVNFQTGRQIRICACWTRRRKMACLKQNKTKNLVCRCCAEKWNQAETESSVEKGLVLMALTIPEQEDKERRYPSSMQGFLAKRGCRTGVFMRGAYDGLDCWQVLLMAQVLCRWEAPPTHARTPTHTYRKALGKPGESK